jgi:hypothetical protein
MAERGTRAVRGDAGVKCGLGGPIGIAVVGRPFHGHDLLLRLVVLPRDELSAVQGQ